MNVQQGAELNWGPHTLMCYPVAWVPLVRDAQVSIAVGKCCKDIVLNGIDTLVFCLKREGKRNEKKGKKKKKESKRSKPDADLLREIKRAVTAPLPQ